MDSWRWFNPLENGSALPVHPAFAVGAGDTSVNQVDKISAYVLSGRGVNILKCVTMVRTLRGEGYGKKEKWRRV